MGTRRPNRPTQVWPALRLAVYEASGWRCAQCGLGPGARPEGYTGRYAISLGERRRLTGNSLQRGRTTYNLLELDHIIAYANGGPHKASNMQALCTLCNLRKGCF
jgi:5-methylcytosine-specific restriction endonuclease McrA